MKYLVQLMLLACWILGIAIAKGFWSTAIAAVFAPYAWYLLAERVM